MDSEKPTTRFTANLTAVLIALLTATWFTRPAYAGPHWAPCLPPALLGVLEGILLAHDRQRRILQGITAATPKNLPLRGRAVGIVFLAACLVAVLEQQLAHLAYPKAPFWIRVAAVVFLAVFSVSELRTFILVGDNRPKPGPPSAL